MKDKDIPPEIQGLEYSLQPTLKQQKLMKFKFEEGKYIMLHNETRTNKIIISEETKYELNLFGRELNKDLSNLMELLRKQDEDNKVILYEGRHIQKIILPVEEYQKMCQRLEAIDNSKPSEALEEIKTLRGFNQVELNNDKNVNKSLDIIKQVLLKAQEQEKEKIQAEKDKRFRKIVIEKNVEINLIKFFVADSWNYKNACRDYECIKRITEEDFNFLKEMVVCQKN